MEKTKQIQLKSKQRWIDKTTRRLLLVPTIISASFVIFILVFITKRGISPFLPSSENFNQPVDLWRFLSGMTWFVPPNVYGIFFIVVNTLYIVFLAAMIAIPFAVLAGLFIVKLAPQSIRGLFQTVIELLASIPSVIYGVFGLGVIAKSVVWLAGMFGLQTAGGISTLTTILVLAIMIFPTITLMSVTAFKAVDVELEKSSLALGATKMQTLFRVTLVSAKSGIFTGIILGIGRALGEATAVSMVAGNLGSGFSFDLFSTTRTLTSTMLLGLKETTGTDYDIRFSVGMVLIFVIIVSNLILNYFKRKVGRFA